MMVYETIDGAVYEEYRSREFCDDVGCIVQIDLKAHKENFGRSSPVYDAVKRVCRIGCKYTAQEYLSWLLENRYEPSEELNTETICIAKTAWELHEFLRKEGITISRKREEQK